MNKQRFLLFIGSFIVTVIALSFIAVMLYPSLKTGVNKSGMEKPAEHPTDAGTQVKPVVPEPAVPEPAVEPVIEGFKVAGTYHLSGSLSGKIKNASGHYPRQYGDFLIEDSTGKNSIRIMMALKDSKTYKKMIEEIKALESEEALKEYLSKLGLSHGEVTGNVTVSHTKIANAAKFKGLLELIKAGGLNKVFSDIRAKNWYSVNGKEFFVMIEGPSDEIKDIEVVKVAQVEEVKEEKTEKLE